MATTGPTQLQACLNSQATFQSWGQGIAAALVACGLVKTADTGQINWATVTLPATSSVGGYEIYRLSDALQSTAPFFFKVEYGIGVTLTQPSIWLTVGTATNGAGTISSQPSNRMWCSPGATKANGTTLPVYASGDNSRFSMAFQVDTGVTNPCWLVCERTRDATGAYTADGLVAMAISVNGGQWTSVVPALAATGAVTNSNVASSIPLMPVTTTGSLHATATDAAQSYITYFIGKPFFGIGVTAVARADAGVQAATFTSTVLGASHTFINLPSQFPDALGSINGTNTSAWSAMLWE